MFTFATNEDQWQHDTLADLVQRLEAFVDPVSGLAAEVQARLDFARTIEQRSITGASAAVAWDEAIRSIADANECPLYHGLRVRPQLGLLPLGRDPHSGLWEFAHLQSGTLPERDPARGEVAVGETTAIVLVLLPGGRFLMGAQSSEPSRPNYDPSAQPNEGPPHELELAPFFLSKDEMTQGQWLRATGSNPSTYAAGEKFDGRPITLAHPVEQVSWIDCQETLRRLALALPTEAQWEYASRAGTGTPWSTGAEKHSLEGSANLADRSGARVGASWPALADWPELEDGFAVHAPVGSFKPNPFGLHDMQGNVWEWCRDWMSDYNAPAFNGVDADGERIDERSETRVNRGGSFTHAAFHARSSNRNNSSPDLRHNHLGLRPARPLER